MSKQANIDRGTYSADLFVGRQAQIKKVLDKAAELCDGNAKSNEPRVTIFGGEVGLGKTWLLKRIMQELRDDLFMEKVIVYNIDLSTHRQTFMASYSASEHLLSVMRDFAAVVLRARIQQETLPAASRQVIEATQRLSTRCCLALFIDEVFEADWEFLELFEEYMLGPLAIEPHVLITMAGRGHGFPFATPELRLFAETETLLPFDQTETRDLVEKVNHMAMPAVEQIQAISQGVPLTAAWLARHPQVAASPDAASLNQMIEHMLAPTLQELRANIRAYVEALSVLNAFDDERVQTLMAIYLKTDRAKQTLPGLTMPPPSSEVLPILVHQSIARYEVDLGAYVIDEHLRALVRHYLQLCEPDRRTWHSLHSAALNLYTDWTERYKEASERWRADIEYHQIMLNRI